MSRTILKNARLIDGVSREPRDHVSIAISGERIVAVDQGEIPPSAQDRVVDLAGRTVLPGLIDTHVHATFMDRESLPLFLAAGVTTVRDLGANVARILKLRAELESGATLGPRLFAFGPLLDGAASTFDRDGPLGDMLDSVPSEQAVPHKIGGLLDAGVDGIKLYFTMPTETAKAVIRFVDKRVPVTGHLGYASSLELVRSGIDGMEHVMISPYNDLCPHGMQCAAGASMVEPGYWERMRRGWEAADLRGDSARRWIDAMVERQVDMGTTLVMLWMSKFGVEASLHDVDRRYIPPMARARQRAMFEAMGADMSRRPDWDMRPTLFEPADFATCLEKHQEATRLLHEAGGVIVGGTDAGISAYPPPGFILLREIEMLAEAIGAMDAIRAVTSAAAKCLRQDREIGTIEAGKSADLLIVDGDPLRDTRELRKLKAVYLRGVAHDPTELLSRVPRYEAAH